jgi:SET domain-containing protein
MTNKQKELTAMFLLDAGWGIFSRYAVAQGKVIYDYLGEVVSQEEAERRGRYYDKVNRSYLFNVNSDQVVDAFRKGNKIKFANHQKRPNCEVKLLTLNRQQHIVFFAKRDVEAGEELFFDYRYDQEQKSDYVKKNGVVVDWMKDGKRANTVRKRPLEKQLIQSKSTTTTTTSSSKRSKQNGKT